MLMDPSQAMEQPALAVTLLLNPDVTHAASKIPLVEHCRV